MYKLAIKKSARKELDNLPDKDFLKIDKAIISLRDNPCEGQAWYYGIWCIYNSGDAILNY